MIVLDVKFIGSWPSLEKLPDYNLPEIALIGRSNVGKSTLINSIVGRKSLARVSATPGKTREAVLFEVRLGDSVENSLADGKNSKRQERSVMLVDLPGFGYAKVGKSQKQDFQKLITAYIKNSKNLKIICLLNDCRRAPSEDEMLIWQAAKGRGCIRTLVITKTDKVGRGQLKQMLTELKSYYPGADYIVESGTSVDKKRLQSDLFASLRELKYT